MGNGPALVSRALQRFCDARIALGQRYIESFDNRLKT
jgi:hypothetical protein